MTDRELLELAAKAAGYEVWIDIDGNPYVIVENLLERPWDPLNDDGDLHRLLVRLRNEVCCEDKETPCRVHVWTPRARRAVVRAVAEIGSRLT